MDHWLHDLLSRLGWAAFTLAFGGWLLLNGGAALLLWWRRDRTLVERYTSWWVALNVVLLAIGVGVPAVTAAAQLAVRALQPGRAPAAILTTAQTPVGAAITAD